MDACSMNMVWNWETTNICILTSAWRVTTPLSLYLSLGVIALAGVVYEWLRLYIRHYDARLARSATVSPLSTSPHHRRRASVLLPTTNPASSSSSNASSTHPRSASMSKRRSPSTASGSLAPTNRDAADDRKWVKPLETSRSVQVWRSTLYATSIAISFLLMLIGMTFNAYVIAAIVAGKYAHFCTSVGQAQRGEVTTDAHLFFWWFLVSSWVVCTGAGLGHYWFNRELSSANPLLAGSVDDKGLACHM